MCFKVDNEFKSIKALMDMSLDALIADAMDVNIDELDNTLELRNDLGMQHTEEIKLKENISDYFDGLDVDMQQMVTIADLHELVVDHEFQSIPAEYLN